MCAFPPHDIPPNSCAYPIILPLARQFTRVLSNCFALHRLSWYVTSWRVNMCGGERAGGRAGGRADWLSILRRSATQS